MLVLLQIRLIQIRRELNHTGFGVFVLAAIFLFLLYISFQVFQKTPEAYYLAAFLYAICVYLQINRRDKAFVYVHIQNPHKAIYIEYLAVILPFLITALFTSNRVVVPVLISALWIVPYFKFTFQQKTYFKNISKVFSATDFEWISGIRKSFLFIIALYLLALVFSWFRIAPLFFLWFITVTVVSFYSECEPLHFLKENSCSPQKFLHRKLMRHSKYLIWFYLPVLVINTLFNPEFLVLNLLFIPLQISLVAYAIFLKYTNYLPNKNQVGNNILLSLVSMGALVPYFLPIPVLLAFYTHRKAIDNLKNYLDD